MFIKRNGNSKDDAFDPTKGFLKTRGFAYYLQEWRGQRFRRTGGPLFVLCNCSGHYIAIGIGGIDWVHMAAITFVGDMAC